MLNQTWRREYEVGGWSVGLKSLRQSLTYEGLLEGLPTIEMNRRRIDGLKGSIKGPTFVLSAVQTPIEFKGRYPFGTPSALPNVQCVARLGGSGFTDPVLWRSSLTVVWFQDDWAFPIDEKVLAELSALDWRAHANEEML